MFYFPPPPMYLQSASYTPILCYCCCSCAQCYVLINSYPNYSSTGAVKNVSIELFYLLFKHLCCTYFIFQYLFIPDHQEKAIFAYCLGMLHTIQVDFLDFSSFKVLISKNKKYKWTKASLPPFLVD